jgi:hypothetical protein
MRRVRSATWVCCRLGIMTLRLPSWATGADCCGSSAVVVFHAGKKIRLPGRVLYVLPVGDFQITVPSGSCRSVQPRSPVQNVLSRWCYRFEKVHFSQRPQPGHDRRLRGKDSCCLQSRKTFAGLAWRHVRLAFPSRCHRRRRDARGGPRNTCRVHARRRRSDRPWAGRYRLRLVRSSRRPQNPLCGAHTRPGSWPWSAERMNNPTDL